MRLSLKGNSEPNDQQSKEKEYFTGEKDRLLLVHVMQNQIEVDKPVKAKIWYQQVEWRRRIFPIDPSSFIVDSKGIHHQYVSANDVGVLRFGKDHEDQCRKCGGKMFTDARNLRDLTKRKTIEAIWGIDSSQIVLLIILGIAMLGMVGFAFYEFSQNQTLDTKIKAALATNDVSVLADKPVPKAGTVVTKP